MEESKRVSIEEGFFASLHGSEADIRLAGTRCTSCGEVFLGRRVVCENCSSMKIETVSFSKGGVLWSYTVIRHPPPPGYQVPGPFKPYVVGLVELPEGIRVMSPIDCDIDQVQIGMKLEAAVYPLYQRDGADVMAFKFIRV